MLVGLGLRAIYLRRAAGAVGARARASSRRRRPRHPGTPAHIHIGTWTLARRPLLVGAVHGLAGSGALTALVLDHAAVDGGAIDLHGAVRAWDRRWGWRRCRVCSAGRSRGSAATARSRASVSFAVGCVSTVLGLVWGYPLVEPAALKGLR